jgi:hypothetical protein
MNTFFSSPGYRPNRDILQMLLCRLGQGDFYQMVVSESRRESTVYLGLSRLTTAMADRLGHRLGDTLYAFQLVVADRNLLDVVYTTEGPDAEDELERLRERPELLSRDPRNGLLSEVHGTPRPDAIILFLCGVEEPRTSSNLAAERTEPRREAMWAIVHPMDLVPANLGDPLMRPAYEALEWFSQEIVDILHEGRYRRG